MALSTTEDDLDLIIESVLEPEDINAADCDTDAIVNALMGVQALFKLRYAKVFQIFETLVNTGRIYPNKNDAAE
jgi:hypothetical protein